MTVQNSSGGKRRTISVTSVFSAPPDAVWERLQYLETLQFIARPYATFAPLNQNNAFIWRQGATLTVRLKLFGLFSLGVHTIHIEEIDAQSRTIRSREYNQQVPVWNHTITLQPAGDGATRYTDTVEVGAGWKTPFVAAWARLFYRHRQRRWTALLTRRNSS